MNRQSDLLNALFLVMGCVLPFCSFIIIISVILVRNTKARWKEAKEISENLNNPSYVEKLLPVPVRYLPIFIAVSLTLMGGMTCLAGIMIAYYLDLPVARDINSATLGSLSTAVILVTTVMVIGFVIFDKIRKVKK